MVRLSFFILSTGGLVLLAMNCLSMGSVYIIDNDSGHRSGNSVNKEQFKRRTLHVPNLMLMSKILCSNRFSFDSAHEKFDV